LANNSVGSFNGASDELRHHAVAAVMEKIEKTLAYFVTCH